MRQRRAGFTLWEILLVMVVLLLLAALLFPALGRVREQGRQANCQGNLKQIYLAFQQYVQDCDAQYPKWWQWENQIAAYIKDPKIYTCPSQTIHGDLSDYNVMIFRMNAWDIHSINPVTGEVHADNRGENEAVIQDTSRTIMSCDLVKLGNPLVRTVPIPASCGLTFLNNRPMLELESTIPHNGGGNYLFFDGHVKWLTPETHARVECASGPFRHRGTTGP